MGCVAPKQEYTTIPKLSRSPTPKQQRPTNKPPDITISPSEVHPQLREKKLIEEVALPLQSNIGSSGDNNNNPIVIAEPSGIPADDELRLLEQQLRMRHDEESIQITTAIQIPRVVVKLI